MVVFALSCFGLLLFLWLTFGGAVPLKPKGYRVPDVRSPRRRSSRSEADVRISGVPVGKVKTIEPDKHTGRATVTIELESRYAPLPTDARAILRQKTLLGETYVELTPGTRSAPARSRRAGSLRGVAGRRRPSSSTRSSARSTRTTRAAFQVWMQIAGAGDRRPRAGPQRRARQPRAVRRGRQRRWSTSSTGSRARSQRAGPRHRRGVRRADRARRPAALADRELQPRVRRRPRRATGELQQAFRALPTFERESRTTLTG